MTYLRASLLSGVGIVTFAASPAVAAVDEYTVEPSQRLTINLDVCSAESQLAVRGDSSTDLDFVVTDPDGATLVDDAGIDDYLSMMLSNESDGCVQFSLAISNLGSENNDLTVVLEPVVPSSTRVRKHIVQGSSTEKYSFKACGTSARVSARGDGDTDLDFIIRNSDGGIVHEDAGTSDATSAELAGLLSDCEEFEIEVANLGDVYNAMMLVVEPVGADTAQFSGTAPTTSLESAVATSAAGPSGDPRTIKAEASGPGQYFVDGNTRLMVDLPVCGTQRLEVRGSGVSDLDFAISDSAGKEVHSDLDLSDVTFKTLEPNEECETYSLSVNNLGGAQNAIEIALIDPQARTGEIGAGEYLVKGSGATKVALQLCEPTNISARGGGGTDLDFDVTDGSGTSIHSDYGLTDATEFTVNPGGDCKDYQIAVNNLGSENNLLTIAFGEEEAGRKQDGPFVAGPTRPTSGIARPGQIVGFRKGSQAEGVAPNRNIALRNNTGEALESLFWSNSATVSWGDDKLSGTSLARNQQWNVVVSDGSEACLFDFRAITAGAREIEVAQVNVCEVASVNFE